MDAAWRRTLDQHVVALSRRVSLVPLALAGDGRTFFASLYSDSFSGVVRVDALTSDYTPIRRFAQPDKDQADGSFDGRWLVWNEYHSLAGPDDFTTWCWDSKTGETRQIGAARRSPSGEFWISPWRGPDARDGFATWTQGSGPDSQSDVIVVDLATGHTRIIRRGHPSESFLLPGGLVVWTESMERDVFTIVRAADVRTGHLVPVPPALAGQRGRTGFATDGKAIGFVAGDWSSLWLSPTLATPAQCLFTPRKYHPISNPIEVGGKYVCFGVAPHTYLANTVNRRYLEISPGGWTLLASKDLVLLQPSAVKASHAITDIIFLPLSSLPRMPTGR